MNKKIIFLIIATILTIIVLLFFIVRLLLSGYFADKTPSDPNICNDLKEDELCVCEKYEPPICKIEKRNENQTVISSEEQILEKTYINENANFSISYPVEWGPVEADTSRKALSGTGDEFYVLFANSNLSISGNTFDFVPWGTTVPNYNGGDPFLYCKNIEEKVVSIERCSKVDKNKTALTYGQYSDMGGLNLLRQVFINNPENKYKGITFTYRFDLKKSDLREVDEKHMKTVIINKLGEIDQDIVKTFDNIVSSFKFID